MQLWQYCLLVTARSLYMFRTLSTSMIRSTKTVVAATGACHGSSSKDVQGRLPLHYAIAYLVLNRVWHSAVATDLGHPYWIYIIPTHDMHQWLLLQF